MRNPEEKRVKYVLRKKKNGTLLADLGINTEKSLAKINKSKGNQY